jgi:hypothetical protein
MGLLAMNQRSVCRFQENRQRTGVHPRCERESRRQVWQTAS